jgi:hypothetical protein
VTSASMCVQQAGKVALRRNDQRILLDMSISWIIIMRECDHYRSIGLNNAFLMLYSVTFNVAVLQSPIHGTMKETA